MECLLAGVDVPKNDNQMDNPNIWIADSAATTHITANKNGAEPILSSDSGTAIRMGNGAQEEVEKLPNIPGFVCDKRGNEQFCATLGDVVICPNVKYNLFSVSKILCNGWMLSGDKHAMTLEKGPYTLKFDIVIPTPKGAVYTI